MAGTRWVKIDTSYLRNPKITGISTPAVLIHLGSILWTADQLTDGHIPTRTLGELAVAARISHPVARRCADELVDAGLWKPDADGWTLHDFAVMNRQALRHNVEAQRKAWRDAKSD